MSEELKIEKDRVLAVMAKCEQFKTIAQELWPELITSEWKRLGVESAFFLNAYCTSAKMYIFQGRNCASKISFDLRDAVIDNSPGCNVEFKKDYDSYGRGWRLLYREKK